jgi:hypothetical protein
MATITTKIIGVLYVLLGAAGFVLGDEADRYHSLLHLATGIVGVYVGFLGSPASARQCCLALGAGYLVLGGLGFALGDPSAGYVTDVGLFSVSTPDHIHHMMLGGVLLVGGTLATVGLRPSRVSSIRRPCPDRRLPESE